MLGRTDLQPAQVYAIIALAIIAGACDLARGRIFNWVTVPGCVLGLVAAPFLAGWGGLADAFVGALLGLALYGALFWFQIVGGGDVKFLAALGAWGGSSYVLDTAFLGVVFGGVMAAGVLAVRGRLADFARRMHQFFRSILVKGLEPEKPKLDTQLKMLFGIPIAVAAIWIAVGGPLPWR